MNYLDLAYGVVIGAVGTAGMEAFALRKGLKYVKKHPEKVAEYMMSMGRKKTNANR